MEGLLLTRIVYPFAALVGGFAKYLTNVHSSSCNVIGLERFTQLLADEERKKDGRGVLTCESER